MNINERYALGQLHFNDGEFARALEYLSAVFKENAKYNESELARMLLWIYTKPEFYDARRIVEMFEILRERYPSLEIPFDRILVVGKAYRDIGENERAWLGPPRRDQRQLHQRRRHQRRARGRRPLPWIHQLPGTRLARIPGHRGSDIRLFRAFPVALSKGPGCPQTAERGQRATGRRPC